MTFEELNVSARKALGWTFNSTNENFFGPKFRTRAFI